MEDIIHLYLGCDVQYRRKGVESWNLARLVCVNTFGSYVVETKDAQFAIDVADWEVRLLLRPLSDMTRIEELQYLAQSKSKWGPYHPEDMRTLLSKGFDLFGLIEAGLAIDKTKQEVKQ